jgi:hypothetical protein
MADREYLGQDNNMRLFYEKMQYILAKNGEEICSNIDNVISYKIEVPPNHPSHS